MMDLQHNIPYTAVLTKRMKTRKRREILGAWMFIAPGFLLFAAFIAYPLLKNIAMAFMNYSVNPNKPSTFIGLANFRKAFLSGGVLDESQRFYLALRNTLLCVLVTVPFQWIIGMLIAIGVESLSRGKMLYRFLLYIPVISDWIVVTILFKYIFQDTSGSLVNSVLLGLHLIKQPVMWLQNEWTANIVIWTLCIWKGIGWVMMIYIAALQDLPKELFEAAQVDGANRRQTLWKITVPLLKPRTNFVILSLVIGAFNVLLQVMLLTNGGPVNSTDVMLNYLYNKAFSSFDFGYAAALSLIMGLILVCISIIQNKVTKNADIEF